MRRERNGDKNENFISLGIDFGKKILYLCSKFLTHKCEMAKIDLNSPFYTVSGRLSKKDDIVFRTRNGKSSKYKMNIPKFLDSDKQLRHQDLVKEANRLVSEEFSSTERKDYWKSVASDESNSYKTARGAAFAHFLAKLKKEMLHKKYFKKLSFKHLHSSKKSRNFAPDFNNNIMSNPFI